MEILEGADRWNHALGRYGLSHGDSEWGVLAPVA